MWYSLSLKSLLDICFVDEAPLPVSAGKRLHDGVSRRFEVFGGMLVRRRIAASDMPANQAHPQLDPAVSCFQALFAALRVRCYVSNLVEMSASFRHFLLLLDENPRAEFSRCAQSSQFGQFAPGPWHGRPARGKRDLTRVWIIAGTAMPRLACECLGGMRFPRISRALHSGRRRLPGSAQSISPFPRGRRVSRSAHRAARNRLRLTIPFVSLMARSWLASMSRNDSLMPDGQSTSIKSAFDAPPSPKCSRRSFCE